MSRASKSCNANSSAVRSPVLADHASQARCGGRASAAICGHRAHVRQQRRIVDVIDVQRGRNRMAAEIGLRGRALHERPRVEHRARAGMPTAIADTTSSVRALCSNASRNTLRQRGDSRMAAPRSATIRPSTQRDGCGCIAHRRVFMRDHHDRLPFARPVRRGRRAILAPCASRDCRSARRRAARAARSPARARPRRAAAARPTTRRAACPPDRRRRAARAARARADVARAPASACAKSIGSMTFSAAVSVGSSWKNWKTMPTARPRHADSARSDSVCSAVAVDGDLAARSADRCRRAD